MDCDTRETEAEEAASQGDLDALKAAVSSKCTPEVAAAALLKATEGRHWPAVQYLVEEAKIDVAVDGVGSLVVQHAAVAGRLDVIDMLVRHGVSLRSTAGSKALLSSAATGQMDILRYVAEGGADVVAFGGEAAWGAAKSGGWEAVEFLIAAGADLDLKSVGVRLLVFAEVSEQQEVVVAALAARGLKADSQAGAEALAYFASTQEWEPCDGCVKYLVVNGADVAGEGGDTALVTAAKYGDLEVVRFLVENGVDASRPSAGGEALSSAGLLGASSNTQPVVDFLLAHGAVPLAPPPLVLDEDF